MAVHRVGVHGYTWLIFSTCENESLFLFWMFVYDYLFVFLFFSSLLDEFKIQLLLLFWY